MHLHADMAQGCMHAQHACGWAHLPSRWLDLEFGLIWSTHAHAQLGAAHCQSGPTKRTRYSLELGIKTCCSCQCPAAFAMDRHGPYAARHGLLLGHGHYCQHWGSHKLAALGSWRNGPRPASTGGWRWVWWGLRLL